MTESVGSAASTISEHELLTELVPSPVSYRVLRPPQVMDPGPEGLPLLLMLHGGGDSAEFLATMRPLFDGLWADGTLPPMVVATPSAGRSFYLDYFDGSQLWEQFLLDVEAGRPHQYDFMAGVRGLQLVEAGYQSSNEGRRVELPRAPK